MRRALVLFAVVSLGVGCDGLLGVDFSNKSLRAAPSPDGDGGARASDGDAPEGSSGCPDGTISCAASGACEVNARQDPNNCGACGHDCLGGTCTGGLCDPVVLAAAQPNAEQVALDETSVYFTSSGDDSVRAVPLGGGDVKTLAAPGSPPLWEGVWGLAVDATQVFWVSAGGTKVSDGAIGAVGKLSGGPKLIASTEVAPLLIAVDDARAYWTDVGAKAVRSSDKAGSATTFEAAQSGVRAVAVDATHVYWSASSPGGAGTAGVIRRRAKAGGSVEQIAETAGVADHLTAAGDQVIFTVGSEGVLGRVARAGGEASVLFRPTPAVNLTALATDGALVFVATATGEVIAVPLSQGAPRKLASGRGAIKDLAVNARALFWAETSVSSSDVMRLAK